MRGDYFVDEERYAQYPTPQTNLRANGTRPSAASKRR